MIAKNKGHIVNVASLAGLFGMKNLVDYCTSKFAAVGLHDALQYELVFSGKTGVKTTVVCPFFIDTGMFSGVKVKWVFVLGVANTLNHFELARQSAGVPLTLKWLLGLTVMLGNIS